MTDIQKDKRHLRAKCAALRAAIPPKVKATADLALCKAIAEMAVFGDADLLLTFSPVRGEPDLSPLAREALARGIPVAFPRCEGEEMVFHTVTDLSALEIGRFAIPTPPKTAPIARPTARTLCLLPALAAAKNGARLGYGGGFYDRFLARFKGFALLPIYEQLLLDTCPTEPTDRKPHLILTEKGERYRNA